jgi:hypothetical protein
MAERIDFLSHSAIQKVLPHVFLSCLLTYDCFSLLQVSQCSYFITKGRFLYVGEYKQRARSACKLKDLHRSDSVEDAKSQSRSGIFSLELFIDGL